MLCSDVGGWYAEVVSLPFRHCPLLSATERSKSLKKKQLRPRRATKKWKRKRKRQKAGRVTSSSNYETQWWWSIYFNVPFLFWIDGLQWIKKENNLKLFQYKPVANDAILDLGRIFTYRLIYRSKMCRIMSLCINRTRIWVYFHLNLCCIQFSLAGDEPQDMEVDWRVLFDHEGKQNM